MKDATQRLPFIRPWMLRKVLEGTDTVVWFQKLFGVNQKTPETKGLAYYFFLCAAALGTEIIFITMLPFLFWYGPSDLARAVCFTWGVTYYIGQVIKDYLQLPRPPMPPVVVMEHSFSGEYGMPSTHVMGAVTIPFTMAAYFYERDIMSWTTAYGLACIWLVSVAASRVYMGVHSPADLIGGAILGVIVYLMSNPMFDALEARVAHSPKDVQLITPILIAVLLLLYPSVPKWTSAYGDTATIMGANTGIVMGCTLHPISLHYYGAQFSELLEPSLANYGMLVVRLLFGVTIVLITRLIFKTSMTRVFRHLLINSSLKGRISNEPYGGYVIEIPTKYVTYSMVGFNSVYTVPVLMRLLGLT